jgi:hypothetical protein
MNKKHVFLIMLIPTMLVASCNRPGSRFRDGVQAQDEPTQAGPVQLPEVETQADDEAGNLINDLDALLYALDSSLYAELEWQIEVPDESSLQSGEADDSEAVGDLLDELANSLGSLGDALAEEGDQQLDTP